MVRHFEGGRGEVPEPRSAGAAEYCRCVLDQLRTGVLLVRPDRTVTYANDEGLRLVGRCAGIAISPRGRLLVRDSNKAGAVHDALALAVLPSSGRAPGSILRTEIGRDRRTVSLVLEVHALTNDGGERDGAPPPALVVLIDAGSARNDAAADRLAIACGLTPAESEVCRALVAGHSMLEVARLRRVGLETVRTQVRSLGRKTGTRSRAALVQLAMRMWSPIDGAR